MTEEILIKRAKAAKYQREYYAKNRDRIRKRAADWRLKNPERWRETLRAYSAKHAEHKAAVAREWRKKNPDRVRALRLWKAFRITPEDYDSMLKEQGGFCAICRFPERVKDQAMAVDHDHKCCDGYRSCGNCIRGLLCGRCNSMIGLGQDNPETLENAARYLRTAGHKNLTGRRSA